MVTQTSSNETLGQQKDLSKQQHQLTLNNRVPKIQSVKPPPPSTKIPKSAVVMPDGSSNSSSFNLDVQFGVDFDSPSKFLFILTIYRRDFLN